MTVDVVQSLGLGCLSYDGCLPDRWSEKCAIVIASHLFLHSNDAIGINLNLNFFQHYSQSVNSKPFNKTKYI